MRHALILMMVMALGCGDDKGGIVEAKAPGIEVREGSSPIPRAATLLIGASLRMTVANPGEGELLIKELTLDATHDAFALVATLPTANKPVVVAPGGTWTFDITFDAAAVPEGQRARADIALRTNTTLPDGLDGFAFVVMPESTSAKLVLQPPSLDFAKVESGTTSTKPINILNKGAATLTIDRVQVEGATGFSAAIDGTVLTSVNGALVTLPRPIVLAPSSARQVFVTFTSTGSGAANGQITFFSDDPAATTGTSAPLYANLVGPCLRAVPPRVDFGAKQVGNASTYELQLESCGDLEVEVTGIEMVDDGGDLFSIDLANVALPLRLAPGIRKAVPVTYFPTAFAAQGSDGQYILDRGRLRVASNAYVQSLDVELSGFGSGCCCPVATIDVSPASEVIPQTRLTLSSAGSSSTQGEITRWEWSVLQPDGSLSQFLPSNTARAPTFTPNIVGTYIFRLDVYDAGGTKSCASAEKIVEVTSGDPLHVELLWRTPGDINESDEGTNPNFSAGSDADLHFLHPLAAGQFFDPQFDCYFKEPLLEWGPPGEVGNPSLDRDDRDGGGPENLNVAAPEDGALYTVGVHYYNDWGYGNTFATVRIYIYGTLRMQSPEVELRNASLWESHTIAWPSGTITPVLVDGLPKVTPGYPIP